MIRAARRRVAAGLVSFLLCLIIMKQRDGILIVDDDRVAREMFTTVLGQSGYTVEAVRDGFEALARLERSAVDLVLTDLKMPGMDGLELIQKIHATDPGAPVILVTGASDTLDVCTGAKGYGAADCLLKPINLEELLWAIDRALVCNRDGDASPVTSADAG